MQPAYHTPSSVSNTPSSSYRHTKATVQKQYRKKEGECVSTLREVIKELTGKEPHTRQDVLRKSSIDLLKFVVEIRRPDLVQAVSPDPVRAPYLSESNTVHSGDLTQSFHEPQVSQFHFNAELYGQNPSYIPEFIPVPGMDFDHAYTDMAETYFPSPTAQTIGGANDLSFFQEYILATYFLPQPDTSFPFEHVQHF